MSRVSIRMEGADLNFFCSGHPKAERRDIVVAFAIRNDIVRCLPCLPHGINDRPMSLYLPLHFMFYVILMDAYRDEGPGIRIPYRTDEHLFKNQLMQVRMGVSTATVHDFLFVEDCAFNTVREKDIQRIMDLFFAGCA
ncbi:unnamed protein product [Schistocephalus solidus]|uniref:Helitron_like_N domain-containing protein n=1 Tax=Schistocephalus solidus TaxID=70667 RepID=A0A183S942_SCHSO|nr:unnamed protein product [Schistocephalus solidus]